MQELRKNRYLSCWRLITFGSRHYRTLHEMFPADLEESELFRKTNALELAKQRKAEQSYNLYEIRKASMLLFLNYIL